jgi:hypothetical protein
MQEEYEEEMERVVSFVIIVVNYHDQIYIALLFEFYVPISLEIKDIAVRFYRTDPV